MTRASEERPTKRIMKSLYDEYVVELGQTYIKIRPKGTKRGGPAEVELHIGSLHQNALRAKSTIKRKDR